MRLHIRWGTQWSHVIYNRCAVNGYAGAFGVPLNQQDSAQRAGLGLGTFLGVITPTMLTILGVILYLRVGWVVGNAGIAGTLLIVLLAHIITFTTALSLSTLATSMRVGGGGAYWLISRSMGLELGGALGIPLYISQALSLTLYSFVQSWPW